MRNWRWVTCEDLAFVFVWFEPVKPVWDKFKFVSPETYKKGNVAVAICKKRFEELFGFAPGFKECIKVEFSGRILDAGIPSDQKLPDPSEKTS